MKKYQITIIADDSWDKAKIAEAFKVFDFSVATIRKKSTQRTNSQNASAHKYFTMVSDDANEKGLTMDALIVEPTEFPITASIIKDFFREVGWVMYKKKSTAQLTTAEFSKVVDVCQMEFAKRLDCQIPFPSIEYLIYEE